MLAALIAAIAEELAVEARVDTPEQVVPRGLLGQHRVELRRELAVQAVAVARRVLLVVAQGQVAVEVVLGYLVKEPAEPN